MPFVKDRDYVLLMNELGVSSLDVELVIRGGFWHFDMYSGSRLVATMSMRRFWTPKFERLWTTKELYIAAYGPDVELENKWENLARIFFTACQTQNMRMKETRYHY